MRDIRGLAAFARRQGGAITRDQATFLGLDNRALATAVRQGALERRHPHVFVLAGARTAATEDWAALLAAGPGAVASAWSASRRYGWDWGDVAGEPCVTLPVDRNLRLRGVCLLRWRLPDEYVQQDGRMRITSPARTVADCLRLAPRHRLEWMLDTALVRRWTTAEAFARQVRCLAGQRGVPVLRALLADVASGARSRAERLAQQVLLESGVTGWEWNYPVDLPDGGRALVDAALPRLKIAVEIDGRAYHVDTDRFQRDRTRQNGLVALGWVVLRFTWADLTRRPEYLVRTVVAAVERAS